MSKHQPQQPDTLSDDEQLMKRTLHQHLNAEADNLDFNITSKLAAARHRALDKDTTATSTSEWLNWKTLTGTTAALTVALVVGNQLYSPATVTVIPVTDQLASSDLMADLPILSASDDIEFYQSIEFLEWMESNSG